MKCKTLISTILASTFVFSCLGPVSVSATEQMTYTASSEASIPSAQPVTKKLGGVTISNIVSISEKTGYDNNGSIIHIYNVDVLNNSRISSDVDGSQFYLYMMNTFNEPEYELTIGQDYVCPAYRYSLEDMGIAPHPTKQASDGTWSAGLSWDLNFGPRPTYFIRTDVGKETTYFVFYQTDTMSWGFRHAGPNPISPSSATLKVNKQTIQTSLFSIQDSNYVKLEDLALAFNGTPKQFQCQWNEPMVALQFLPGQPYQPTTPSLTTSTFTLQPTTASSTAKVQKESQYLFHSGNFMLPGQKYSFHMNCCLIDGSLYVRLQEIAEKIDFSLVWDPVQKAVLIDTSKGYGVV